MSAQAPTGGTGRELVVLGDGPWAGHGMSSTTTPSGADGVRPGRVQRRRSRGWRMPAGVVYVGRPSRWGNPYPLTEHSPTAAVALYRAWLLEHPDLLDAARAELGGRSLACWCPPGAPCHADVLLDLANSSGSPDRRVGPGGQSPAPPAPTSTSTSTSELPRSAATAGRALDTTGAPS